MTDQQHIDAEMERDIEALGLTAPRITPEQIDALMAGVTYDVHVIPGTTTTIATAIAANGFTLAIGMTACADPANFNAEFGAKYAIQDAASKAKAMLWKLEGWRLKCRLEKPVRLVGDDCQVSGTLSVEKVRGVDGAFPAVPNSKTEDDAHLQLRSTMIQVPNGRIVFCSIGMDAQSHLACSERARADYLASRATSEPERY